MKHLSFVKIEFKTRKIHITYQRLFFYLFFLIITFNLVPI